MSAVSRDTPTWSVVAVAEMLQLAWRGWLMGMGLYTYLQVRTMIIKPTPLLLAI